MRRDGAVAKAYERSHITAVSATGRRLHGEPKMIMQFVSWIITGSAEQPQAIESWWP
jgi:hypothetical protein